MKCDPQPSILTGLTRLLEGKTTIRLVSFIACWLLMVSTAMAELKIDAVYPTLGKVGKDLAVTVTGEGFNQNTRLSLALDTGNSTAIISSVRSSARTVTISGTTAYVITSLGLQIVDVKIPSVPNITGMIYGSMFWDVEIAGTTAYVVDFNGGLHIIDISNPIKAAIIGTMDTPGFSSKIVVSGTMAYVAGSPFQIFDISDPTAPFIIGSVDIGSSSVSIKDTTAYVNTIKGLKIIDISIPSNPKIVGSVNTSGIGGDIAITDTTAYVVGDSGLQVIDVSDLYTPIILSSFDSGRSTGVSIADHTAYVSTDTGLEIVDISDPKFPVSVGFVDTGQTEDVAVLGKVAYVTTDKGLQIIDVSDPTPPANTGSINTLGEVWDIALSSTKAYVADRDYGLQIIDISNPSELIIVGSVETPGSANSVFLSNNYAFLACGYGGVQIINISDPTAPEIIGSVDTYDSRDVAVLGDTLCVADFSNGLQIVDITKPAEPNIVGSIDLPGAAYGVSISENKAFVAGSKDGGLQVIDISKPSAPIVIGSVETLGSAFKVYISGNNAYVADYGVGLTVVDISNPASPGIIGNVSSPEGPNSVFVSGNRVFAAVGINGLQVIDVSDPTTPIVVGQIETKSNAMAAAISGNMAFVVNSDGMVVLPAPLEIKNPTVNNTSFLTCTLTGPTVEGFYNLCVFNPSESYEMNGAVSFMTSVDFQPQSKMKAIIVAGGGDYPGNSLWQSTRFVTNQAFKTLVSQGYAKENIYYLGEHSVDLYPEDDNIDDVDAPATSANLSWAINVWATDASELFLYMTDHGKQGTFQLNADEPYFRVQDLDTWLDSLQSTMPGKVVCVYDACNSGSFLPLLTPPAGKERFVIASSQADERAWFMNQGVNSFSYQFWASAWLKGKLYDAFLVAKNMMAPDQTALLDANGDGTANTKADQTATGSVLVGRGRSAASLPPNILSVPDDQILNGPTQANIWADLGANGLDYIDRVWAVVVPPDHDTGASDIPVIDLPGVDLLDTDDNGTFDGEYNGFNQKGTYRVIIYAKDTDDLYSLPKTFTVNQLTGSSSAVDSDYNVTHELWAKAVLEVPGSQVDLVWEMVGADITPSGDQVVSGYFYADPDDFAYGSIYNPEVFVKIYIAANGWANIAFNHVTVDPVSVYSAHNYTGSSTQTGSVTLTSRLVEHSYTGVDVDNTLQSSGGSPGFSGNTGYTLGPGLWAKTTLQPVTGPVNLIWKEVGTDTTPSGDRVISGYFYASPEDFPYGSPYNPELFVKIYIASNGWANIAFNHVTVDGVDISSAHNYIGTVDQSGTATLEGRLVEHRYNGVGLQ